MGGLVGAFGGSSSISQLSHQVTIRLGLLWIPLDVPVYERER